MVAGLVRGMSIALYTTLIGSVLHLWLMVVYRMVSSGTLRLYDEATVLGVSFDEGRAIYLWLLLDDTRVPGYYALPGRPQIAEKLQNLIDEAMEDRTSVRIKNPFSRSGYDDLGDLNAYVVPPPTRPFKPPPTVPRVFNPRAGSI